MEPPVKRLRLAQVADVDEHDPDYIYAKQEQQRKLKSRLESIFAKFENMHDSMSDEIDMTSNKIVVDRGHLRRLDRQMRHGRNTTQDVWQDVAREEPEDEEQDEDSEDELAPTQLPKTKKDSPKSNAPQTTHAQSVAVQPQNFPAPPYIPQVPATPNAAAQLLQMVQFPTTPAGQQAQHSFVATLTQSINQAVHNTLSSLIQNTPHLQLPFATAITPIPQTDAVIPPKDPKWFFPPLPAQQDKTAAQLSSPIASNPRFTDTSASETAPLQNEQDESELDDTLAMVEEHQASSPPRIAGVALASNNFQKRKRQTSPRVQIQGEGKGRRRPGPPRKYHFTHEDNVYISKKKLVDGCTWKEIIDSRENWRTWPAGTLSKYWANKLRGRDLHLEACDNKEMVEPTERRDERHEIEQNQLLTPSWSEHEEEKAELVIQNSSLTALHVSSSASYDEADLDLLSLNGDDQDEDQIPMEEVDEFEHEVFLPDADEDVIPSIEITDFVDEDDLQQGLLEGSPEEETMIAETQESIIVEARESSVYIKTEEGLSSPIQRRRLTRVTYRAVADTESAEEDENTILTDEAPSSLPLHYVCHMCNAMLKTEKNLERHIVRQHPAPTVPHGRSQSLDFVHDDEIDLSFTPSTKPIKREIDMSSPAWNYLCGTPAMLNDRYDNPSSGVKSASGLSRRAFLKQTKQSWAKNKTPRGVQKRKSFNALPRKRVWDDVRGAESEDELA